MDMLYGEDDSEGAVDPLLLFDDVVELGPVTCLYSQLLCAVIFVLWAVLSFALE